MAPFTATGSTDFRDCCPRVHAGCPRSPFTGNLVLHVGLGETAVAPYVTEMLHAPAPVTAFTPRCRRRSFAPKRYFSLWTQLHPSVLLIFTVIAVVHVYRNLPALLQTNVKRIPAYLPYRTRIFS
jgi:hypothetical protein